jgi:hypothetical protein
MLLYIGQELVFWSLTELLLFFGIVSVSKAFLTYLSFNGGYDFKYDILILYDKFEFSFE